MSTNELIRGSLVRADLRRRDFPAEVVEQHERVDVVIADIPEDEFNLHRLAGDERQWIRAWRIRWPSRTSERKP